MDVEDALALVSAGLLGLEARALWPQPNYRPKAAQVRRLIRSLAPSYGQQGALIVFTMGGCSACAPVSLWRIEWESKWRADRIPGVPIVLVGGDRQADIRTNPRRLARAGVRAFPCLAVMDRGFRMRAVELGFQRTRWDRYLESLLRPSGEVDDRVRR